MIELLAIFLLCLTVITAIGAVMARDLFAATMLMGIFSLLMAVSFLLLDAADVALTEAAVGAGISTVLLLAALSLTSHEEEGAAGMRPGLALIVVSVTAAVIFYATFDKPPLGDPTSPVNTHVSAQYFSMTKEHVEIPNVVTGVLSTFRGYDTLGEVVVVLTAAIGVLFLLGPGSPSGEKGPASRPTKPGLKHDEPLRIVGKIAIPFIVLFALYVQFHGEYSPGGGFQAGALLAAAIILYGLLEGRDAANSVLSPSVMRMIAAMGGLLFGGVGVVTMLLGGNFLDYDVLLDNTVKAQQVGIIVIEAGVGIAVAGVLMVIYHAFSARGRS